MAASPQSSFLQTQTPAQTNIPFGYGPSSQRPVSPVTGFVYSDTTLNIIVLWSGTVWITIGATQALPFSAGSSSNYPTTPSYPYLYWNSTTQQLNLWNGTTWVIIGPIAAPAPSATPPPQITTQPASQTVAPGTNTTFTVVATGAGSLSYQWLFNNVNIGGATSSSFNLSSAATSNGGVYTVNVTGAGGSTLSQGATLTVTGAPVIVTNPSSQTISAGGSVSFTVTATGTATLTYQWYLNSVAVSGAVQPTYTLGSAQSANAGSYTCTVTNGLGSATSSAATLVVTASPYLASWTSFSGVALLSASANVILGFIVQNTNAGASTVTFQLASSSGTFPPGVGYSVFNASGGSVVSGASVGGETNLSNSFTVAQTAGATTSASYTIVTTYTANLVITGSVTVAGAGSFINSSLRATVIGTSIAPPNGYAMQLQTNTLAASSIVNMLFYQSLSHTYLGAPFAWNFNLPGGQFSTQNPQNNVSVGNSVTMVGYAPASGTGDSVLELDAVP